MRIPSFKSVYQGFSTPLKKSVHPVLAVIRLIYIFVQSRAVIFDSGYWRPMEPPTSADRESGAQLTRPINQ
jgi:hypothetical protein